MRYILLILIILSLITVVNASTFNNVKMDKGETWVSIIWNSNITTNIYLDGSLITDDLSGNTSATNFTMGYYRISGIEANSKHTIQLVNASNNQDYKQIDITTTPPSSSLQIFFVLMILIFIAIILLSTRENLFPLVIICILANLIIGLFASSIAYNAYQFSSLYFIIILLSVLVGGIGFIKSEFWKDLTSWG